MNQRQTMTAGQVATLRLAYAVALALALGWVALVLVTSDAARTLGFDFRAYLLAAERLLAGQPLYDPTAQETGGFGLFFYPPPFALLLTPFTLLPEWVAVWTWTLAMVAGSGLAVWLMPVDARVRWIVLLLAAVSWPLVFALKLGQVGPLILLTFAIGWRWLDRPWALGLSAGLGTIVKIQPALVIGWALVTGRRRAAAIAIGIVLVLSALATIVVGVGAWFDEASLLARVSRPILTPHAFGVGRLAYEAGVPEGLATAIHYANLALVAIVVILAVLRAAPAASYLAVVVASQFASPVLWDHYALVLLLPVAYLLHRGHSWAAAIPLATSTLGVALAIDVPWAYPAAFWAALLGVTVVGLREAHAVASAAPPAATPDARLEAAPDPPAPRMPTT